MDEFNRSSFRLFLAAFIEENNVTTREIAKAIGCSDASLSRILAGTTEPSDDMLKQGGILFAIGLVPYTKLSAAEKEKLSEAVGAVGGGAVGFASITAAISTLGSVAGLSAAGISSGLASFGSIVGGGMLAGVSVAAAVPLAGGAVGYAIIKGVRYLVSEHQLNAKELDPRWEVLKDPGTPEA